MNKLLIIYEQFVNSYKFFQEQFVNYHVNNLNYSWNIMREEKTEFEIQVELDGN